MFILKMIVSRSMRARAMTANRLVGIPVLSLTTLRDCVRSRNQSLRYFETSSIFQAIGSDLILISNQQNRQLQITIQHHTLYLFREQIEGLKFQTNDLAFILYQSYNIKMSVSFHDHLSATHLHENCEKKLQKCEQEYKKQIALLNQQIQFLKEQLKEHQTKVQANKRINQSIMLTYQQTQNFRSQHVNKEIQRLKNSYQSQIRLLKESHYRETKRLEQEISEQKRKTEQLLLENDKRGVQLEKKIHEVKKSYEEQLRSFKEEIKRQMDNKEEIMKEKIRQAEHLTQLSIPQDPNRYRRDLYLDDQANQPNFSENFQKSQHNLAASKNGRNAFKSMGSNFQTLPSNFVSNKQNSVFNLHKQKQTNSKMRRSCSSEYRKSRLRQIEENNVMSQHYSKASRESIKLLAQRIDRAATYLKSSNNLHHKLKTRLERK